MQVIGRPGFASVSSPAKCLFPGLQSSRLSLALPGVKRSRDGVCAFLYRPYLTLFASAFLSTAFSSRVQFSVSYTFPFCDEVGSHEPMKEEYVGKSLSVLRAGEAAHG